MDRMRDDREEEKPLHTCGHLSPVSKETDPPLTGVYGFLLLWDDDVVEGAGVEQTHRGYKGTNRKGSLDGK